MNRFLDWLARKRDPAKLANEAQLERALDDARRASEAFQREIHGNDFLAAFLRPQPEEKRRG